MVKGKKPNTNKYLSFKIYSTFILQGRQYVKNRPDIEHYISEIYTQAIFINL